MGSGLQRRFVDWEEKFVSHDRGGRVVHYYLRDRQGQQCLAVIGTERSLRHMVYVVSDDFLPLAGLDKSSTSAFKWRARREVVDWLSSFLIRIRSPEAATLSAGSPHYGLPSSIDADSSFSFEGADGLDSGQEDCRSRFNQENDPRKQYSHSTAEVVWVGSGWTCRKRLRHFHSFQRNGITISVRNFIYVMTEEKDRHIAYVEDLFEDKKLRKKLRVRWFHKINELTCEIPPPVPHSREVFYTTFQQDLSVECVDGVATVLAPEHYDTCLTTLTADAATQVLLCSRQFHSEGIKPFIILEVKGYWQQPILSLAGIVVSLENSTQSDQGSEDLEMDDEDSVDPSRRVIRGPRTARYSRRRTGLGYRMINRASGEEAGDRPCMSGEAGGSGPADVKCPFRSVERTQGTSQDHEFWRYVVGDHVEVLCEDSGLRGCWFKATILRRCFRWLKVRYDDVICEDGNGNVEEWISSCKISEPCKLGVRITGRTSIRPCRPEIITQGRLNEGEVVDAWWNDGWWEGIICGKEPSGLLNVFIPGENETATLKLSELRVSKEWLNGTWAPIPSQPDLITLLGNFVSQRARQTAHGILQSGDCRSDMYPGLTHNEGRCQPTANEPRIARAEAIFAEVEATIANIEAMERSHSLHDSIRTGKDCSVSVKEESKVVTVAQCADEPKFLCPSASPRSAGPSIPIRLVFRQLQQDSQGSGVTGDINQNGVIVANSGSSQSVEVGLKWKAGKKRHRQGETATSRVDRSALHSTSDVEDYGMDDVNCDANNTGSAPLWKSGKGEEIVRNKHRKGNDSSLKSMHGTPMGNSLFMGALPIANLVMSR